MRKILIIAGVVLLAFAGKAQPVVYDAHVALRDVKGFHAIAVSGGIDLYLATGDEAVAVSAENEEVRNMIKTEVENGVLKIYMQTKKRFKWGSEKLKVYVSGRNLDGLTASGGSDILVQGVLSVPKLSLTISGGSDFKGEVQTNDLRIAQSGGSDVIIKGKTEQLAVDASGGSDFNGFGLATDVCIISASGGSDLQVTANKEIHASASGASDISWKGSAQVKKLKTSGAGSITPGS